MREDTPIKKKVLRELVEKEMNALQEEKTEFEKTTNNYAKTLASLQISQDISLHQFSQETPILNHENQIISNDVDLVDTESLELDVSNNSLTSIENTNNIDVNSNNYDSLEHDLPQQKIDLIHEDFEIEDIENHFIENLQHQSNRNNQISIDEDELEL